MQLPGQYNPHSCARIHTGSSTKVTAPILTIPDYGLSSLPTTIFTLKNQSDMVVQAYCIQPFERSYTNH